jgi:arylsulfatase A-like enzyme
MRNAKFAARVQEEHSETAYMTNRAMDFIRDSGNEPWCLHLSYIKPHWPYMAPAPYHDLYAPEDVQAPNRSERERRDPHPVRSAFMQHEDSKNFARDAVRETVIPAYMGLVKQIDDHLGRLWKFLEAQGQWENTMIVFTSDHGDYLGDHWLGEKDLFHDESVRIPLLIHDPSPQADATRGTRDSRMVEGIDLLPTFIEWLGGTPPEHRLEGASLLPLLHGTPDVTWRDYAISESDYSNRRARGFLGLTPQDARATMVCTERWKGIFHPCFRPELYDLQNDPQERMDLGDDPEHEAVRRELKDRWFEWILQRKTRVTISEETIKNLDDPAKLGILIGYW